MKKLLLVISLFLIVQARESEDVPRRMYSFYTPSHTVFKDEWFLPSIKDDYEVIINFDEQRCDTARFCQKGWKKTTTQKITYIIEAIRDTMGEVFVYSDIDIQFFAPTKGYIIKAMRGQDLVFQRDTPSGSVCSGFFACRSSEKTLKFFQGVQKYMRDNNCSDQEAVNGLIRSKNPFDVHWSYLPKEFFGGGTLTGRQWKPGKRLPVPYHIILHHANWTFGGIDYKIKQLKYVKSLVKQRKR